MIVHPKLPNNPYNSNQLQILVDKYEQVTDESAKNFFNIVEKVIEDNFPEDELLDYSIADAIKSCFFCNAGSTPNAEIFLYSVLKETIDYCLYHKIYDFKFLIKSIKY